MAVRIFTLVENECLGNQPGLTAEFGLSLLIEAGSGVATLGNPGEAVLRKVAATVAGDLGWDENRINREVEQTNAFLKIPTD